MSAPRRRQGTSTTGGSGSSLASPAAYFYASGNIPNSTAFVTLTPQDGLAFQGEPGTLTAGYGVSGTWITVPAEGTYAVTVQCSQDTNDGVSGWAATRLQINQADWPLFTENVVDLEDTSKQHVMGVTGIGVVDASNVSTAIRVRVAQSGTDNQAFIADVMVVRLS